MSLPKDREAFLKFLKLWYNQPLAKLKIDSESQPYNQKQWRKRGVL